MRNALRKSFNVIFFVETFLKTFSLHLIRNCSNAAQLVSGRQGHKKKCPHFTSERILPLGESINHVDGILDNFDPPPLVD